MLRNCQTAFWLYHFAFPPVMNESSCWSTSLSAFDVVSVPYFGHSNRCVMAFHCFNLQFPNYISCWMSFQMLTCHPYLFWWGACSSLLLTLKFGFFSYCWVSRVLWIFYITALFQVCLLQIFSQSVSFLFFLLILPFTEQKILVLVKSSSPIISFMDHAFGVVSKNDHYTQGCLDLSYVIY